MLNISAGRVVSRMSCVIVITLVLLMPSFTFAWTPKQGPLMTRWAKDVDPAAPLPEYPRPQLVRSDWQNLNGVWEYQPGAADDAVPFNQTLKSEILVPFPVESALSGVMEHHDRLWYRRTFTVPESWKPKRILIHFDAIDYESEVFINGKSAGVHRGGYDAFTYDITPLLQSTGPQELIVRVFDPTDAGGQPRGKQTTHPVGIMYTPTTGIWQTVWLEPVADVAIQDLKIVPDVDASAIHITVNSAEATADAEVAIVVKDGDATVATFTGKANTELTLPLRDPKLWSPDRPFLYDLDVSLKQGNSADHVGSYFGMRKISLGEDHGVKKLFLNNQFLFQFGPLDQGFWPDGIYTPPTEAALKNDIESMKSLGFNMVRKHIKVEPARWYYWTDKLGLLVWQDMPSANSYLPRETLPPPVDVKAFKSELERLIEGHWNHPSIVVWVPFNESQGQHDTGDIVGTIKALDPSRLINEASGGRSEGFGDILDVHNYPDPKSPSPTPNKAIVCGEYGGIGLKIPDHMWANKGQGYIDAATPSELLQTYADFANVVKTLRDDKGLSAVVYTQLTDVETEVNGLLTYDRLPKCDLNDFARATHFQMPPAHYEPLVPTAEDAAQGWKYTTTTPTDAWNRPDFDDSAWSDAAAPFGAAAGLVGRTDWHTPNIWLRKHFNPGNLTADEIANLVERDFHDEDVQVYINGELAFRQRGFITTYQYHLIKPDAKKAILSNADNVLAVHCLQTVGGQFIDVGLYKRITPNPVGGSR